MPFAPVEALIEAIADGQMVILVDDENRENEGDFVLAAEKATPEAIGLMARIGRGLICAPVSAAIADRLALPQMVEERNSDPIGCAFTVSVDARRGITTGISAFDRALTVQLLADPGTSAADLRRPGHIFPLRACPRGVLERPGHTEAAVDLSRLAGLAPAGVICEIMSDDGSMARLPELSELAEREGLLLGNIEDLIAYRREHDDSGHAIDRAPRVQHQSSAGLPTPLGVFEMHVFTNEREQELIALRMGDVTDAGGSTPPLVRVHSACFTGDVLGSLRCDCGGQLQMAAKAIGEEERGLLIYLPQEGRGIGLAQKIAAYKLQEQGLDTVEANHELGYAADLRDYGDAAAILRYFDVGSVRLMTNNPAKISGLEGYGFEVAERVKIEPGPGPVNHRYLQVKKGKLGHFFEAI